MVVTAVAAAVAALVSVGHFQPILCRILLHFFLILIFFLFNCTYTAWYVHRYVYLYLDIIYLCNLVYILCIEFHSLPALGGVFKSICSVVVGIGVVWLVSIGFYWQQSDDIAALTLAAIYIGMT